MIRLIYLLMVFLSLQAFKTDYNVAPDCFEYDYQRPIVVCISSDNNKDHFKSCLDSIFSQDYDNYRVIYIDDASTDKTYDLLIRYLDKNNLNEKMILLRNDVKKGALSNHYLMGNLCEEDEIIFPLRAEGKLTTTNTLSRINKAYMDEDVWVTYGNLIEREDRIKRQGLLKHKYHINLLKKIPFVFQQSKTYYGWLFRNIPKECFAIDNCFMEQAADVVIMTYLIELSRDHTYFISEERLD